MPPDLRDWVPEDDMVHFVIEAVAGMRLSTLKVNRRGTGSAQYPPKMMLSLLIYCYANGIFSSRRIERSTYVHVAVRYLTGDTHPDHDTICTFRRVNFDAIAEAFLQVLQLAKAMGVLKVGTISVDGTHLAANAGKYRNVRYDRACELEEQLELDIAELMKQAEQTDQHDDDDGQRLPDQISRRQRLLEKMKQARQTLEQRAQANAEAQRVAYERKLAERTGESKDTGGAGESKTGKVTGVTKPPGPKPKPPSDTPKDSQQINLTDADSKLMRKNKHAGYTQSYNGQAAVDADGSMMILAGYVTNDSNDVNQLLPMVRAVQALETADPPVGKVQTVLADSGYVNVEAIETVERDQVEVYAAVSSAGNHEQRRYDFRPKSLTEAAKQSTKKVTDPCLLKMQAKLQTDEGKKRYALRKQTVEPVFGILKSVLGFRQFLLRGLEKVNGEWSLLCLAYNLKRLATLNAAL